MKVLLRRSSMLFEDLNSKTLKIPDLSVLSKETLVVTKD